MKYYYSKNYCKIAVPSLRYEFYISNLRSNISFINFPKAYSINGSTLDRTINMNNKIVHRDLKTNPVNIDLKASIFQYEN